MDVMAGLRSMPDDSVDCVVTSPPYWGLRDYGVEGQIGMEQTLGEHLDVMVAVFEEIKRVLKPTGTLWLNYGDCYASTPNGRSAADTKAAGGDDRTFRDKPFSTVGPIRDPEKGQARWKIGANAKSGAVYDPEYRKPRDKFTSGDRQTHVEHGGRIVAGGMLKPKDLCMIPNRLAIALQEAGWWVRSEIVWAKPNPMPESIRDRPATAHEKIFLLTKSHKYFYDAASVRVAAKPSSIERWNQNIEAQAGSTRANGNTRPERPMKAVGGKKTEKQRGHGRRHAGFNDRWDEMTKEEQQQDGRSLRNWEPVPMQVWEMATMPFRDAHFATFPPELVERCLTAGCPVGGHVFDPFGGSGTTAMVANQMGMSATLIELNPEYARIAWKRIERESPMFSDVEVKTQIDLFDVDTKSTSA